MSKRAAAPILAFLGIALFGCGKPEPVVVLDSWWSVDMAKQSCARLAPDDRDGCMLDMRAFERGLVAQFAATKECAAVTLLVSSGPTEKEQATIPALPDTFWNLSLDYIPGARKQHWTMVQSPGHALHEGAETSARIAQAVCGIVNQRDGAPTARPSG
jgi:hypothetical protein